MSDGFVTASSDPGDESPLEVLANGSVPSARLGPVTFSTTKEIWNKARVGRVESEPVYPPDLREEIDLLTDWLSILRRRRHQPTTLAKIQLYCLLTELALAEASIKHYESMKPDEVVQIHDIKASEVTDFVQGQVLRHATVRSAVKDLADGIAWRLFGYNHGVMQILGEKPSPGFLNPEGLTAELVQWGRTFETKEGIAVLNGLTNHLRVGDVTVVSRRDDGGQEFKFVEVKNRGGNAGGRYARQREAREGTVTFLNDRHKLEEGVSVQISLVRLRPAHHFSAVYDTLEKARTSGHAWCKIRDYLIIEVADFFQRRPTDDHAREMHEALESWRCRGEPVLAFGTHDQAGFVPGVAPYSIFPLPDEWCARLATRSVGLKAHVNLGAVATEFKEHGWTLAQPSKDLPRFRVRKGPCNIEVPLPLIFRLGREFLDPTFLIGLFEHIESKGPHLNTTGIYADVDETGIWD